MSASRLFLLTTLVACTAVTSHKCYGQPNGHAYGLENIASENDLRWFEPADLDLDGRLDTEAGYFFRFSKDGLWVTGEDVEIGDPNTIVNSEQVFGDLTPEDLQTLIDTVYINAAGTDLIESQIADIFGVSFQEVGGVIVTESVNVTIDDGNGNAIVVQVDIPQVDEVLVSPPDPYVVRNSILDATTKARIGWGEEYEFGWSDGERGWMARVIDGPEVNSGGIFGRDGFPLTSQSGTGFAGQDPYAGNGPNDNNQDGSLDNPLGTNDIFAFGFGSVAVNFAAPTDFFVGFRDYFINDAPNAGTQYGPIYYVGNYGADDDSQGNIADDDQDDIPGIADDIDGDGSAFFFLLGDANGDGEIDDDEVIATLVDFGDLYSFNIFFDSVNIRNRVEMDGVELMFTHELGRGHKLDRGRSDDLQLRYGVNFLRFRDDFQFEGLGSILGRTTIDHEVDNQLIGPSVGLRWRRDHGRWDVAISAQATLAYNIVDHRQQGIFGEELIMGALNRPINGRTTLNANGLHDDDFSPMAELRAEARYKITKALALKIGYKAKFIDNIYRSSESIGWTAPYYTIDAQNGKSDVLINGLTMGIEFRH